VSLSFSIRVFWVCKLGLDRCKGGGVKGRGGWGGGFVVKRGGGGCAFLLERVCLS